MKRVSLSLSFFLAYVRQRVLCCQNFEISNLIRYCIVFHHINFKIYVQGTCTQQQIKYICMYIIMYNISRHLLLFFQVNSPPVVDIRIVSCLFFPIWLRAIEGTSGTTMNTRQVPFYFFQLSFSLYFSLRRKGSSTFKNIDE